MVPATGKSPTASRALLTLAQFGLSVFLISLALSWLALPWLHLPWWNVFRRCVSFGSALSLWIFIKKYERRSVRSYGFQDPRAGKRQLGLGLLLGLGALGAIVAIGLATGAYQIAITPDRVRLWRTVIGFIPAAMLVSVLEELVFRGFILQHLLVRSRSLAIIVTSVLYALVHLKRPTLVLSTYLELGGLFLLGCVLAISYLRTRQLYLAIGLHAVLAYGARVNKLLIQFPYPSISWLVGTTRLVNGLLSWAFLLGVGGIIIWWTRSGRNADDEEQAGNAG